MKSPLSLTSRNGQVPQIEPPSSAGVPGFFDYAILYNRMADMAPPGAWLVEVGVFHGLSLRHLAHRAKMNDRNLTVVGVDWGRGSPEHQKHLSDLPYNNLAGSMLATLVTAGVADDCSLILAPSRKAAKFVPDGACQMVFIDGDHSHDAVIGDIEAWLPKIAPGGFLCGHDWSTHPGVRTAVMDVFGDRNHMVLDCPSCWAVQIGESGEPIWG